MKNLYALATLLTLSALCVHAQTPVPAGAGSYASFPPASENQDVNGQLYPFVFDRPIYVADNKKNGPIPTNDWWTDLIISGKSAGLLWAYPLMADPEDYGLKIHFPNSFSADGSNIVYGGSIAIKAAGYTPNKAFAKD